MDLIVFPEYALLGGYPYGKTRKLAIIKNGEIINKMQKLAQKHNVNFIPGSFILNDNNQHYNATCFINNNGEIIHWYKKNQLWADEKRVLSNGIADKLEFVTLDNSLVAIQICADLYSPSLSSKYSKNINMIINISLWSYEDSYIYKRYVPKNIEPNIVQTLTRARAIENRCYFLYTNYADKQIIKTKSKKHFVTTSIGETMIVDPYGNIVAKTSTNKEEILIYDINLSLSNY